MIPPRSRVPLRHRAQKWAKRVDGVPACRDMGSAVPTEAEGVLRTANHSAGNATAGLGLLPTRVGQVSCGVPQWGTERPFPPVEVAITLAPEAVGDAAYR
jgi:hypothetical protein